jgi:hypothetical protein
MVNFQQRQQSHTAIKDTIACHTLSYLQLPISKELQIHLAFLASPSKDFAISLSYLEICFPTSECTH